MRPSDRLFHFNRVNSMPVNMADIVQLPIEALQPIKHTYSIYIFRMYTSYRGGGGDLTETRRVCSSVTINSPTYNS